MSARELLRDLFPKQVIAEAKKVAIAASKKFKTVNSAHASPCNRETLREGHNHGSVALQLLFPVANHPAFS